MRHYSNIFQRKPYRRRSPGTRPHAPIKFAGQNEEVTALKALIPGLLPQWEKPLADFSNKLEAADRQTLHETLSSFSAIAHKDEFLNADFAKKELVSLILETQWPKTHTPKMILEDAIHFSNRRNRERGSDTLGLKLLVYGARREVDAMKVEQALKDQRIPPNIIKETVERIKTSTEYVGEALRDASEKNKPKSE